MALRAAPSTWERVQDYAGTAADIVDMPVIDAAAVIGVEAAWLGGILLGVKFLWLGLWNEFKK